MMEINNMNLIEAIGLLNRIADQFSIGNWARTEKTLMVNIENAARRSRCLSEIEIFHSEEIEIMDGEKTMESLLNWGDDPSEYIKRYKEVIGMLAQ